MSQKAQSCFKEVQVSWWWYLLQIAALFTGPQSARSFCLSTSGAKKFSDRRERKLALIFCVQNNAVFFTIIVWNSNISLYFSKNFLELNAPKECEKNRIQCSFFQLWITSTKIYYWICQPDTLFIWSKKKMESSNNSWKKLRM